MLNYVNNISNEWKRCWLFFKYLEHNMNTLSKSANGIRNFASKTKKPLDSQIFKLEIIV